VEPAKVIAFPVEVIADPGELSQVAVWDPIELVLERFAFSELLIVHEGPPERQSLDRELGGVYHEPATRQVRVEAHPAGIAD
jgi:hypothetical protein